MKKLILLFFLFLPVACGKFDQPFVDPNAEEDFRIDGLTLDNFPFMDCSTSTSPLRDMVMYHLLDIQYTWGFNVVSGSQYAVTFLLPEWVETGSEAHKKMADILNMRLRRSSGSHGAYVNLIDGTTGVIIDSRDISRNESQYARQAGVTVETKPLAWDALVFIVHPSNKVKSLTQGQIRDIYTGKVTNWRQVGGADHEIHAYTRDPDSGSQEKMETLVMQGQKMLDLPEMQGNTMLSPYISIETDEWGIAYTPYYFCERMVGDLRNVKVLAVDGTSPTPRSIMNAVNGQKKDAYPFYSHIYAAIRSDAPADSFERQIYRWLSTPKAKDIIDESGYISLRSK